MMYQKFEGHEQAAARLVYDEKHNIRYQTAKQIYIDNYKMNIYTGEVLPL